MSGPGIRRRAGTAIALALAGLLAIPTAAGATSHLTSIREVFPGSTTKGANTEFVELQMYAGGQTALNGTFVTFYEPMGGGFKGSAGIDVDAANGESQRTFLVGSTDLMADFGVAFDFDMGAFNQMDPAGGAVCFGSVDCVSWGNFDPSMVTLPSSAGTPAAAIPDESSLERTIAPGCATFLEGSDDTNSSADDFAAATPTPRNNATTPTETPCPSSADVTPPDTEITKAPKNKTEKPKAKYRFESDEAGSTFECAFDKQVKKQQFEDCESGQKYKRLDDGKHKFQVAAIDAAGNVDPTPAADKFKVVD